MELVDAHCHLQDGHLFRGLEPALQRAALAGVRYFFCNGTNENDWEYVLELGERFSGIVPWIGLHPWFVEQASPDWEDGLTRLLASRSCGLGEIGLDRALKDVDFVRQEEAFVVQLRLAEKFRRPVAIHCRKAWERLVLLLESEGGLAYGGLVHSYSGSAEMVPVLERLGCSISFSCSITRPANKKARKACLHVSEDRLLAETDSPAIAPAGVERDHNEPANVLLVVQTLAELLGRSVGETAAMTTRNALALVAHMGRED